MNTDNGAAFPDRSNSIHRGHRAGWSLEEQAQNIKVRVAGIQRAREECLG